MANKEVAIRFIDTWRVNSQRLDSELESLHNETHRKPDNFYYEVSESGLIDPQTKKLVKNFIDRETQLGLSEFKFLESLEDWSKENEEATGVWISPPYPQRYPCSKAIFYQVAYSWEGQKVLTSSAILFDATGNQCLEIASEITAQRFENSQMLRESLLPLDENAVIGVLEIILKYSGGSNNSFIEVGQKQQVEVFARMIKEGASSYSIYQEMQRSGFIGEYSISCSSLSQSSSLPTFSEHTLSKSGVINFSESAKFVKRCGNCGKEINSFISRGYRCSACGGVYEGC